MLLNYKLQFFSDETPKVTHFSAEILQKDYCCAHKVNINLNLKFINIYYNLILMLTYFFFFFIIK